MSQKNNTFFDTFMHTEDGVKKIRIMTNPNTSRNIFLGKGSAKSPVKLSGITKGSTQYNEDPMLFYNSNTGSRIMDEPYYDIQI